MGGVNDKKADDAGFLPVVLSISGAVAMLVSGSYICRLAGAFLLLAGFMVQRRRERQRVQVLTAYLEQADRGNAPVLSALGEDALSRLEDQIYKTVTYLYQTREEAVRTKNEFARNLSNIAHQIKTPITAISLQVQTMEDGDSAAKKRGREQMIKQLTRLTHLEEADRKSVV